MKKLALSLSLSLALNAGAQVAHPIYLKANALFLPIGMLNTGFEYGISKKYTLEGDVFISPWKSFDHKHAQVYMGHLEGRYYFDEAFHHWYLGVNAGMGLFDIEKYNYFGTGEFQRGYNFMFGATAGYQWQWKERWNVDLFLGAGTSQALYHGYEPTMEPPYFIRYEHASRWNKSGEFLPYRGGIMVAYKLR